MFNKHLMNACLAAVLALGLAACGGSSSDTATAPAPAPDPEPPAPTMPAPTAVTLPSDGDDYLDAADLTLTDQMIPLAAGASMDVGAYTLTCSDAGPCEVTIADGAVTATGDVTAAYTTAAMGTINAAKMAKMDETEGRALGLSSAVTDTEGTRGEAIRGTTKADDLNFARGLSGGAMVSHDTVGWATSDAGMSIPGWAGKVVSRETQSYTVYTDIASAKRKAFTAAYPDTESVQIGVDNTGTAVSITVGTDSLLTFTAAEMTAAANNGLLDPSDFPQPPDPGKATKTYTYALDEGDTSGTSGQYFKEFTGTFHGATGTYECTEAAGSSCTVSVTAPSTVQGAVYSVTGGWTFTPDTKNNPQIIEQDTDHMRFGWWLDDPAEAAVGGEYLHDAQVFFGGNQAFPDANIADLHGEVEYEGPAAGLYAVTGDDAAHGEFRATAKLTADFGEPTGDRGSVSGTIESFVRDDGVANNWELTLSQADLAAAATTGSGNIVDGNKKSGGWDYALFGPGGTGNVPPTGIAGAFDAQIDENTAVAGAFATK